MPAHHLLRRKFRGAHPPTEVRPTLPAPRWDLAAAKVLVTNVTTARRAARRPRSWASLRVAGITSSGGSSAVRILRRMFGGAHPPTDVGGAHPPADVRPTLRAPRWGLAAAKVLVTNVTTTRGLRDAREAGRRCASLASPPPADVRRSTSSGGCSAVRILRRKFGGAHPLADLRRNTSSGGSSAVRLLRRKFAHVAHAEVGSRGRQSTNYKCNYYSRAARRARSRASLRVAGITSSGGCSAVRILRRKFGRAHPPAEVRRSTSSGGSSAEHILRRMSAVRILRRMFAPRCGRRSGVSRPPKY